MIKKINTKKGFSVIELIVVVAIVSIISGVAVFNYTKFNNDLSLTNMTYDVALNIRETQVFGLSVKSLDVNGFPSFDIPYGISFSTGEDERDYFVSFADLNGNSLYDGNYTTCDNECVSIHHIERGNYLDSICLIDANNCAGISSVNIIFKRPNPEAIIMFEDDLGNVLIDNRGVDMFFASPSGTKKIIAIEKTGQISIQNPPKE